MKRIGKTPVQLAITPQQDGSFHVNVEVVDLDNNKSLQDLGIRKMSNDEFSQVVEDGVRAWAESIFDDEDQDEEE